MAVSVNAADKIPATKCMFGALHASGLLSQALCYLKQTLSPGHSESFLCNQNSWKKTSLPWKQRNNQPVSTPPAIIHLFFKTPSTLFPFLPFSPTRALCLCCTVAGIFSFSPVNRKKVCVSGGNDRKKKVLVHWAEWLRVLAEVSTPDRKRETEENSIPSTRQFSCFLKAYQESWKLALLLKFLLLASQHLSSALLSV